MKPYLIVVLWLITLLPLQAQQDPVIQMAESLKSNVVRLEVSLEDGQTAYGFGFVTNEGKDFLYLVTAAHVVHGKDFDLNPEQITVHFSNSLERKRATEITWFEAEDLALLRVAKPGSYIWRFPFEATAVSVYDEVSFIGRNNRFNVLKGGYIIEINNNELFFAPTFILPGTSGAPLINRTGIVGMITDDSVEDAKALSIQKIKALLQVASGPSPYFVGGTSTRVIIPPPEPDNGPKDDFVKITGGSFEMGDVFGEGDANEKPVHTVRVSDFWMSPTEVTNQEVAAFLTAEGNQLTRSTPWYEIGSTSAKIEQNGSQYQSKSGFANHPVVELNWYGAIHFCNWKSEQLGLQKVYRINGTSVSADWQANGYRLPTEAEWEYAAREGGQKVRFGNGANRARASELNFDASAAYKESYSEVGTYRGTTVAVNTLKKNDLGLYHLSGNVWEWCWDRYDSDYYSVNNNSNNPKGPSSGDRRVVRGGSWYNSPNDCRVSGRHRVIPADRYSDIGFRLVRHEP